MIARLALIVTAAATPCFAIHIGSSFDTGADGWTLEGPGTLEWVATGGNSGGHLRVTRTGPGEVYLVAPSLFRGDWRGSYPRIALSYKPPTSAARGIMAEITTSEGQLTGGSGHIGIYSGAWTAVGMSLQNLPALENVTQLRLRLGTDPALPIGEVMRIDDIWVQSCATNLDGSTLSPLLTANDFVGMMNAWATRDPRANFDGYNGFVASDWVAFINHYAIGCETP